MKTLLKNRRTYRNRIGTLDDNYDMVKEEDEDEESDLNGDDNNNEGNNTDNGANTDDENNTDSWEDMYQTEKAKDFGGDEDDSGGPEGVDEDEGNGAGVGGSKGGVEDGSRGVSGRKDDEGSIGTKRKNQDDEPAAKAKRTKKGSEGHQAATKSTKKALPKTRSGKKKD